MAKTMRTTRNWSNWEPYINRSIAFGSYASDLAPFQGAPSGGRFPGLKPWAKSYSPDGANPIGAQDHLQFLLNFAPFSTGHASGPKDQGNLAQGLLTLTLALTLLL